MSAFRFIGLLVATFTLHSAPPSDVPRDFAIYFELGLCWRDVVDTRTDRYVRDLATRSGQTRTVRLRLSSMQWRDLSRWVEDSRFFELPTEITASRFSVSESGEMTSIIPSANYVLDIRSGGRRHKVEFNDDNPSATSDALTRVRELVKRLEQFFTQLPQVRKLPEPAVGCL